LSYDEKNPKRSIRYFFSTLFVVSFFAALQMLLILLSVLSVSKITTFSLQSVFYFISLLVVIYIVNKRDDSATYKLAWCVPILVFPLVGGLMYIFSKTRRMQRKVKRQNIIASKKTDEAFFKTEGIKKHFETNPLSEHKLPRYLHSRGFPAYGGNSVDYFPIGEKMYEAMLIELEKAKKFIFLEFFIVQEGQMLDKILEILKRKAQSGVEVKLMYDGMGSIKTLPRNYCKRLEKYGIKAKVFMPYKPVISTIQNNRDHRKIVVIDGEVGFCGGINLADEYINAHERFGHWKDSGVMIKGSSVNQLTRFFLQLWCTNCPSDTEDLSKYFVQSESYEKGGYVVPYTDTPLDNEPVGLNVYVSIITRARKYIYIMTPYLIPGEEIVNSLKRAAKSGIDVRIITPHKADKKIVHAVSRSYYPELIRDGVRIFEYTPGFCHSKNFVSDDEIAVVGSINLDYRSLFLHYENAVLMYDKNVTDKVKADFLETQKLCAEITLENIKKQSWITKIYLSLLRLFEPLL